MNIPLNIDIQQILLHLLNFAILGFGLYVLLYKPVKNFMEKRTAGFEQMEKDAEGKLQSAKELEASYREKMSGIENEIRQKRAAAEQETELECEAELKSAKAQAEKLLADARKTAEQEKEGIVALAGREIADLAAEAADRLLKEALKNE